MIGLFFYQTERMQNQLKTYCIIGDPIRYSLSPAMQNAAFKMQTLVPSEARGEDRCD